MPTTAGPNTYGEENLVFSYDLGDLKNSYKGKPTVNFISELGNPTQEITGGEFSQYYNLVPVFETHGLVPYTLSMEMKGNKPGDCLVYMQNGSYTKYGFVGTWVTLTTEWKRFVFANLTPSGPDATWQANTPNDHRAMLATYTGYGSARVPTVRNVQLEHGAYATPFTAGTRSATQGLIDLKGNSTIDLSNVSFDSSAQMIFDGTNDSISIGSFNLLAMGVSTLEAVVYMNNLSSPDNSYSIFGGYSTEGYHGYHEIRNSGSGYKLTYWTSANGWKYANTALSANTWYHVAWVWEGLKLTWYVNGVADGSYTFSTFSPYGLGFSKIGYFPNERYMNGKIPLAKVYNRALTASEVASNYKAIKGRFNI